MCVYICVNTVDIDINLSGWISRARPVFYSWFVRGGAAFSLAEPGTISLLFHNLSTLNVLLSKWIR